MIASFLYKTAQVVYDMATIHGTAGGRSLLRPPVRTFEVVMRRNTFLRYLSYSSPRILNPLLRAATTNRAVAIDCGMLAAMEAKEGPPKGYMADEAVQKKQTRRLAECSFKTKLETGNFTPGCLSEKVNHQATHNGDTWGDGEPISCLP